MPDPILAELAGLDPIRDHQRIAYLTSCHGFPFDTTRALEFALFRTFAVPSIAALLDHTGEFTARAQKRYDDTDLLLSEALEAGYDSERGRGAIARINAIHSRFDISPEDFRYVLSTFVFEPIRWNARFGWRPMTAVERLGNFHYWRAVGTRMGIGAIPDDYDDFEAYNVAFERREFGYTDAGHRVASATRDMFLSWFLPRPLRRLGAPALHAIMDPPLLNAVGFPEPGSVLRTFVAGSLRARARAVAKLPPRRRPRTRTNQQRRSYRGGYSVDSLGPPPAGAVVGPPEATGG